MMFMKALMLAYVCVVLIFHAPQTCISSGVYHQPRVQFGIDSNDWMRRSSISLLSGLGRKLFCLRFLSNISCSIFLGSEFQRGNSKQRKTEEDSDKGNEKGERQLSGCQPERDIEELCS